MLGIGRESALLLGAFLQQGFSYQNRHLRGIKRVK